MFALFVVGLGAGIAVTALALAIRSAGQDGPPAETTSAALRCSTCGVDWPPDRGDYGRCPVCLEPTNVIGGRGVHPLDPIRARSIRLHHEFERFYARWTGEDAA